MDRNKRSYRDSFSEYSDIRTLVTWSAPGRPFKQKTKAYYLNGLLIVFLIEVILFLFQQYLFMVVVGALYFLSITLATIPPRNFHYKISNQGIKVEDHFFIWEELYDFYFKKAEGVDVLVVRTKTLLPGEIHIPLGELHPQHVRKVLIGYIPYREVVRPTFMEKSADWLSHNFPLERS